MFQRALICTDFTDGMHRLAQFVPSLAAGGFQSLTFFHNVAIDAEREIPSQDPEQLEKPKQRLLELLRDVPDHIEVKVEVQMGRASDNILRLAKQCHADIIFLGTPTRTMLEEKLFGSTTMQLAEKAHIPLMVLRPQLISTYTAIELELRLSHLFRYLLLTYDGQKGGKALIEKIRQQVQGNPTSVLKQVELLWVIDANIRREFHGEHPIEKAKAECETIKADLGSLGIDVNTTVVEGDPIQQIMLMAEQCDIRAIATCSSGLGGFLKWSTPSLTRDIIRRSWHPVLYFPV